MARRREMRTVVLKGEPVEMGLRHGRLLGPEIRFLLSEVDRHIFRRLGSVQGAGVRVLGRVFGLAMDRHIPVHLREEMKGVARASGVGYPDVLLLNTLDDVLNLLRRFAPRTPSFGCSSFAIFGRRTCGGTLMHGRNLDYHFRGTPLEDSGAVSKLLLNQATLFVFRPRGRAGFISVGWPGLIGAVTALNQEGISLGNLTSYLRGGSPAGLPLALLYRTVMEGSSTAGEAGGHLASAPRTIGNSVMIGSGRENSAHLYETTRGELHRVAPDDGLLLATNHFLTPGLARLQRPFLLPHSVARWERMRHLCDREGMAVGDALAVLGDEGSQGSGGDGTPFTRVANEGTAVSALFRPAEMELWLGMNSQPPASRGEFGRFDAAALLNLPMEDEHHWDAKGHKDQAE